MMSQTLSFPLSSLSSNLSATLPSNLHYKEVQNAKVETALGGDLVFWKPLLPSKRTSFDEKRRMPPKAPPPPPPPPGSSQPSPIKKSSQPQGQERKEQMDKSPVIQQQQQQRPGSQKIKVPPLILSTSQTQITKAVVGGSLITGKREESVKKEETSSLMSAILSPRSLKRSATLVAEQQSSTSSSLSADIPSLNISSSQAASNFLQSSGDGKSFRSATTIPLQTCTTHSYVSALTPSSNNHSPGHISSPSTSPPSTSPSPSPPFTPLSSPHPSGATPQISPAASPRTPPAGHHVRSRSGTTPTFVGCATSHPHLPLFPSVANLIPEDPSDPRIKSNPQPSHHEIAQMPAHISSHEVALSCCSFFSDKKLTSINTTSRGKVAAVTNQNEVFIWDMWDRVPSKSVVVCNPLTSLVTKVAIGDDHCLALTDTFHVFSWGSGKEGQLGHGTEVDEPLPKQIMTFSNLQVVDIAVGCKFSLILTSEGDVLSFGSGAYGQLGLGKFITKQLVPTVVPGLQPVVQLAAGVNHSLFLTKSRKVFQCGEVSFNTGKVAAPVDVFFIYEGKHTSFRFSQIACGYKFSAALSDNGDVYCWQNDCAFLSSQYSEVRLLDLLFPHSVAQISCSGRYCACLTDEQEIILYSTETDSICQTVPVFSPNHPTFHQQLRDIDQHSDQADAEKPKIKSIHDEHGSHNNQVTRIVVSENGIVMGLILEIDPSVVLDLIRSERSYLRSLNALLMGYFKLFLKKMANQSQKILTFEELKAIFMPDVLPNLIQFTSNLLYQLDNRVRNWIWKPKISDIFVECFSERELGDDLPYIQFTKRTKRASNMFETLTSPKNSPFSLLLKEFSIHVSKFSRKEKSLDSEKNFSVKDLLSEPPKKLQEYHNFIEKVLRMMRPNAEHVELVKVTTMLGSWKLKNEAVVDLLQLSSSLSGLEKFVIELSFVEKLSIKMKQKDYTYAKEPGWLFIFHEKLVITSHKQVEFAYDLAWIWFEKSQNNKSLFFIRTPEWRINVLIISNRPDFDQFFEHVIKNALTKINAQFDPQNILGGQRTLPEIIFQNKSTYKGEWLFAQFHGTGTWSSPSQEKYEGGWLHGKRNGHGISTLFNGERYEGNWLDNKKNGRGKLFFCEYDSFYDKYEGEWQDDKMNGMGILHLKNGKLLRGSFENNQPNPPIVLLSSDLKTKYVGDWSNNMCHGHGVEIFSNGDLYYGDFLYGNKSGKGYFITTDRTEYIGDWVDGKIAGKGTILFPSGEMIVGKFAGGWTSGIQITSGTLKRVQKQQTGNRWEPFFEAKYKSPDIEYAKSLDQMLQYSVTNFRENMEENINQILRTDHHPFGAVLGSFGDLFKVNFPLNEKTFELDKSYQRCIEDVKTFFVCMNEKMQQNLFGVKDQTPLCMKCLDSILTPIIYPFLFNVVKAKFGQTDQTIEKNIQQLNTLQTPQQLSELSIPAEYSNFLNDPTGNQALDEIIASINQLNESRTIFEKIQHIEDSTKKLSGLLGTNLGVSFGADELFPIYVYCLSKSKLKSSESEAQLISSFLQILLPEEGEQSIVHYFFAQFQAAVHFFKAFTITKPI